MAEVTWFKVLTDIFSDDKIKIIQSMPEGDSLLVMWFKVLAQAGKTNDGGYIYLKRDIPYTAGMLATLFGKPQQLVEMAIKTFSQFGMIDVDDNGYIFVTHWEKHQSIDKLNQIKEKANARLKRHREKKLLELQQGNVSETFQQREGNAIEVEVDLDLKKHTTTDFDTVSKAYGRIHGKYDIEAKNLPLLTKLLDEGMTSDFLIQTMEQRYKEKQEAGEKVSGFNYYEPLFRDKWKKYVANGEQEAQREKKRAELRLVDEKITYEPAEELRGVVNG